jgi:hypothetical protein
MFQHTMITNKNHTVVHSVFDLGTTDNHHITKSREF